MMSKSIALGWRGFMLKNAAIAGLLIAAAIGSATMVVQAQSGGEIEIRITAQRLEDGRTEFAPPTAGRRRLERPDRPVRPLPSRRAATRPMAVQHPRHNRRVGHAADRKRGRGRSPHHRAAPGRRAHRVRHPSSAKATAGATGSPRAPASSPRSRHSTNGCPAPPSQSPRRLQRRHRRLLPI